ncbi:DUF2294 domain-containing protein [Lyngbya confervoides]|uniref:DUF2294 domain-containing protein n=1 Tax=Lyngbya confervoides BDU141951 TaxID=1574623 RepID=A0ABD4T0R5_9CYAN|nr:DUF2294 domain-containing protein [Lyngbya confervoides]MCM1981897.1 DUF2294 domain-containing protein [Lyngbya confervoides BDU141951]
MTNSKSSEFVLPTSGQLERSLSQKIRAFYSEQLGHQPSKVSCQLFDSQLAIILEDTVTKPERILAEEGKDDLAEQVREDLDRALQPQLKTLIEEILSVPVLDILSDSTLNTGRGGIIVILERAPQIRPNRTQQGL